MLTGFILLLAAAAIGFWHVRENKKLAQQWKAELPATQAARLERFAWWRTAQLLIALICALLIAVAYGWQLRQARTTSEVAVKTSSVESLPAKEPVASPAPAPAPVPAPAPLPTAVESVYNPENSMRGVPSAIDGMKKRYEDLLVTHFFLKKCGRAQTADYHVIISALSQEMASLNAPGRLQNDILTAAQGSYHEVYAQSACDSDSVDALAVQYGSYIQTLTQNFVPQ